MCSTVAQVTRTRGEEDGNSASVLHVRSDWESYGGLGRRLNPLPLLTV